MLYILNVNKRVLFLYNVFLNKLEEVCLTVYIILFLGSNTSYLQHDIEKFVKAKKGLLCILTRQEKGVILLILSKNNYFYCN